MKRIFPVISLTLAICSASQQDLCCENVTFYSLHSHCWTLTTDSLGALKNADLSANGRRIRPFPQFITGPNLLQSRNGQWKLILQGDGHLVLYPASGSYRWANWVLNYARPGLLRLEDSGDLVVYDVNGIAVWRTGTVATEQLVDIWFIVQDDGDLVLYQQTKSESAPRAVWNSKTKSVSSGQQDINGQCISFFAGTSGVGTWTRKLCPAGTYCDLLSGCVTCKLCAFGNQCPAQGLSAGIPCQAGSHSESYLLQAKERSIPVSSAPGYQLANISTKPDYELSFLIKPIEILNSWTSIIHLTASGADSGGIDARIPAVFFSPQTTQISVFISDGSQFGLECKGSVQSLPLNVYTSVLVRIEKMTLSTFIGGKLEGSCILSNRLNDPRSNVIVFLGDPWYPAAKAYVMNVTYSALGTVHCSLCPHGKWGNVTGSTYEAISCPNSCKAGYSSLTGATSASMCNLICPQGSYCDGTTGTQLCPAGRWGTITGATSLETGCPNLCPFGLWGNLSGSSSRAEACPYSCPKGTGPTKSTGASSQDMACRSNRLDCKVDDDCKYTGCQCFWGEGWCGNTKPLCEVCANGLCYAYHTNYVKCVAVLCPPRQLESLPCPSGSFNIDRSGTYLVGLTNCTPCPLGTYAEKGIGSTTCILCQAGKFTTSSGSDSSSACLPCKGHLDFKNDSVVEMLVPVNCQKCPSGKYFVEEHLNDSSFPRLLVHNGLAIKRSIQDECRPCLSGFYSNTPGATSCLECSQSCQFPGYWEMAPGCTATTNRVCMLFINDAPRWLKFSIACGQVPLVSAVVIWFYWGLNLHQRDNTSSFQRKMVLLSLSIGIWDFISDCTTLSMITPSNPMMIFWVSLASILCSFAASVLLASKSVITMCWCGKIFIFTASSAGEFGNGWPERYNSLVVLLLEACPQLLVQGIAIYQQGLQGFSDLDWAIWSQTIIFSFCNFVKNVFGIVRSNSERVDALVGTTTDIAPVAGFAA
jgi:hypothetical protein